jgi:hypothetical protein
MIISNVNKIDSIKIQTPLNCKQIEPNILVVFSLDLYIEENKSQSNG